MRPPLRMENVEREADGRLRSPSAERNRHEILPVLARALAHARTVLEVASGTGEHAAFFARELPRLTWQPSEADPENLRSIRAWRARAAASNLLEPFALDVRSTPWPVGPVDAVVAINLLHIAPWSTTEALLLGSGRALRAGGVLFVYGAMFRDGVPPEPSNVAFDARLRELDPAYGVRRLEDVTAAARRCDLVVHEVADMPNRNVAVVLHRS